jgi:hypothetical protein
VSPDTVLSVRPLSVVPEGDEFVVGDPESGVFVVLPAVAVRIVELLRSGMTVAAVSAELDGEVDVADFAESLVELGFAAEDADSAAAQEATRPAPLRHWFSPAAWTVYAACALGAIVCFAVRPGLFPRASDIFFLDTPVRSLAALTAITYVMAAAHEVCHWLAARAVGVRSRITVSRRLYFLVLEIDLTGLWSLPRRRRYSALLAGMAFDAVVLFPLLLAQLWFGPSRPLAALTFVEFVALVSQVWIFARTDVYAVFVTATGCVNLFRVNQLMVRRVVRRLTPAQERELAESHERDVSVARWYRWIYLGGLAAAAWFFVAYFAPATIRLLEWLGGSVAHSGPASEHFWEAVVFGLLIFSPQALTLGVAARDLRRWRSARAATSRGAPQPSPR